MTTASRDSNENQPRRWARAWLVALVALAAVYGASGFYSVQSDESGIAFVFGRAVNRAVLPGIHWNPPRPFGRVSVARTATSFVMPIGFRLVERSDLPTVSDLWLTGDTNIVTLKLTVQYTVTSLADFELHHENPRQLLRRGGERVLTRWLIGQGIDGVLTTQRHALESAVHAGIQQLMDAEATGIEVQSLSIRELAPPLQGAVRASFQEVQNANADRERTIHEAHAYRAQTIAEAAGEAEKIVSRARSDRHARVELARGNAQRFLALAREHARAPAVTEERLYLETVDRLLPAIDTYIVEPAENGKVNLRIVR